MVEVMWNDATSQEIKGLALNFLKAQNQVPAITKKEIKGFSLNRAWRSVKKEELKFWSEGYTTPEDFDGAWMMEWGTSYGPFGLMAKWAWILCNKLSEAIMKKANKKKICPPEALNQMVL